MVSPRLRRPLAAVLGALAVAAGLVVAAGPAAAANFYGFAGYTLSARARSVSAQWVVPRIAKGSRFGHARTFASVFYDSQGLFYSPATVDLQVGTTEDVVPYRGHSQRVYSAYWSERDNGAGNAPHRLHSVRAGDVVRASAVLGRHGWTLTVSDLSSGWEHSLRVPGGPAQPTTGVAFMQEDPQSTVDVPYLDQSQVLPYPAIPGAVVFSHLLVDGKAPALSWSRASYLEVANGTVLVPSKPGADGFGVAPPSGATMQYMLDTAQYNYTFRQFNDVAESWTASTPAAQRYAGAKAYIAALQQLDRRLASQHWPAAVKTDIGTLVASQDQVVGMLQELPGIDGAHFSGWRSTLLEVLGFNEHDAELIHADLGIPIGT